MSEYFVRFAAHIDERKRPENFPKVVFIDETIGVESIDQLSENVNRRFKGLVSAPGLVVLKDPNEVLDTNVMTFDKRVFVPWHMITHFEAFVNLLTAPPTPDDPLNISVPAPVAEPAPETPKSAVN